MSKVTVSRKDPRVVSTRGLILLKNSHPEVRRLKRAEVEPSIHGNKIWNSSFLVMDYLNRHRPPKKARFMDVGCGWGQLGIYAAKRLEQKVIAVDADKDVFPYLELHAQINKEKIRTLQRRFEKLKGDDFKGIHTVAGADICFWDELTPVLFNMIKRARKAGVKRIIIADPGRDPFYELVEKCEKKGFDMDVVERRTSTPRKCSADLLVIHN